MAKSITDLRNTVNESTQMISNQLQGVESSLLGAFIAVVLSAFVSNVLGITDYWAPVAFILMWVIMVNSFVRSYIPPLSRKPDSLERTSGDWESITQLLKESFRQLFSERNMFLFITKCKNLVPILECTPF
jgi:hypothetical protein